MDFSILKDLSEENEFSESPEEISPTCTSGKRTSRVRRTVFSRPQLNKLEERFVRQTFLSREERKELAEELDLTERQVMIWFQNRRGRLKRRGHHDSAYSQEKLQELNQRRPYPFLYGLLSSFHYRESSPNLNSQTDNSSNTGGSLVDALPGVANIQSQNVQPAPYPCTTDVAKSVFEATNNPIARELTPINLAVELNIPDIHTNLGKPLHEMTSPGFPPNLFQGLSHPHTTSFAFHEFHTINSNYAHHNQYMYRNMPIQ